MEVPRGAKDGDVIVVVEQGADHGFGGGMSSGEGGAGNVAVKVRALRHQFFEVMAMMLLAVQVVGQMF